LVLLFICPLLVSCSDSLAESSSEAIKTEISNNELRIVNISQKTIYYFAIDQQAATYTLWAPVSTEENAIDPFDVEKIPLSKILVEPDNSIIVNYWSSMKPDPQDIRHVVVDR